MARHHPIAPEVLSRESREPFFVDPKKNRWTMNTLTLVVLATILIAATKWTIKMDAVADQVVILTDAVHHQGDVIDAIRRDQTHHNP